MSPMEIQYKPQIMQLLKKLYSTASSHGDIQDIQENLHTQTYKIFNSILAHRHTRNLHTDIHKIRTQTLTHTRNLHTDIHEILTQTLTHARNSHTDTDTYTKR